MLVTVRQAESNEQSIDLRAKVQKFGGVLSAMVMPNIGAFIAWGILTSLFIPTGWFPNKNLEHLVAPTITYMLPLLIGYTAGTNIYGGRRGGVIGAVATMGVIIGSTQTMLVGGMLMGAFGAWSLKRIDMLLKSIVRPGLEMLVDNFSLGIFGALIMIAGYLIIEPIFSMLQAGLTIGVSWLSAHDLIPFTSIIVQPAQVLFLNNAINHGIMIPIGLQQVLQHGRSILLLVEANGGTWFGLLLAFCIFGKGAAKRSAPASAGIMFFGGIGEVAFPYALAKPVTVFGPMLGNIAALFLLEAFDGGTVGAVSPGSFVALVVMTPKGAFLVNIAAYFLATAVSFLVVSFLLKQDRSVPVDDVEMGLQNLRSSPRIAHGTRPINKVTIVCDAGMGSSAMGLSILKTKCKKAMLDIKLDNVSVNNVPQDADVIITNKVLEERVRQNVTNAPILLTIENFLDNKEYDRIIEVIKGQGS